MKILHLENPMKFISVSKEGYVGLWTINFKLEKVYSATDEANNNVSSIGQNRRRAGMWITDAIYMADVHKLVLASTSRELRFFTISSETFLEEFSLFGILKKKSTINLEILLFILGVKNVPTCLDYYPIRMVNRIKCSFGKKIFIFSRMVILNPR